MSLITSEIINNLGIITLNAERSLNALSQPMVDQIQVLLDQWRSNDTIHCVFLQGSGEKAFCAGGDIREMRQGIEEQAAIDPTQIPQKCKTFFIAEYTLDYTIHTYSKPIVVWGDGIVMGGGLGLLAGASHRIVTERSLLAMPEISIGLYPDVGASFFLNQMPSAYGLFLGMTGARINGADAHYLGLADYVLPSFVKQQLIEKLTQLDPKLDINKQLKESLTAFELKDKTTSQAEANRLAIESFEQVSDVLTFQQTIEKLAKNNAWIDAGYQIFKSGSPSSAAVIFRQLQLNKGKSLAFAFQTELNLSCQCAMHPDFPEGVRALLIDKDKNPQWTPALLEEISQEWIDGYFYPLWTADQHPFKDWDKI
ncbi:enoyl-CoA hydratase/isomerase family protein [Myroides pelagicus]|uniref:enoyl-CoA hydratase/isomerase family protein n=1 Tax=Myroides pelagicus TaxID=270914 RepID=UPI002DB60F32|nr:enoyl-CoA hydratase/isomerase family protein [Myroides pelagicus]MEC4113469.1 enoyl-CoA hydratase/isomerase family protein [Myroides pelagicus]